MDFRQLIGMITFISCNNKTPNNVIVVVCYIYLCNITDRYSNNITMHTKNKLDK